MRPAPLATLALLALMAQAPDAVRYVDMALDAGLRDIFYYGGERTKNYIIETLGSGVAFIDYDNDGNLDIFAVNGSRLEGFPKGQEPTNHLYRNEGHGVFKDVTREAGLLRSGWGQGVCAGDFDNDGFTDLFVTYWGQDVLYRNTGKGSFEDVTEAAGLAGKEVRWGTGCAFVDYNRDGKLDLFVANYVQFDQKNTPTPNMPGACQWKNMPVMCGPRGLKGGVNRLWRNDSTPGHLKFTDVSEASKVTAPGERYSLSVTTLDYDHDGWPDLYAAVDSQASILYRNNGDGSFTEMTGPAGLGSVTRFLGWGVAFVDYDNDGWPDLFLVNGHVYPEAKDAGFKQRRLLFRNRAGRRFEDVSLASGEGVSAEWSGRG